MKGDKFKDKSFKEIAGEYGEEAAINAGIAADPDTYELDEEWIKEARPASEVIPDIVQRYQLLRERELAAHVTQSGDRGGLDSTDTRPRKPVSGQKGTSES